MRHTIAVMSEADADTTVGGGEHETVVVPGMPVRETLAWSEAEDALESQPWRVVWSTAGVLVMVGVVAAVVVGAVVWVSLTGEKGWAPPKSSTASVPPPSDAQFVEAVRAHRVPMRNEELAVVSAKMVCTMLGRGDSRALVLGELLRSNPDKTVTDVGEFMDLAVEFYCPDKRA